MKTLTRREFLKLGVGLGAMALAGVSTPQVRAWGVRYDEFDPPPAPLGRVINWQQVVRKSPSTKAEVATKYARNDIIPLLASVVGDAPWPSNPIWYQTSGGFVHSGYIQLVQDTPGSEVIQEVTPPGFWAEVCVPIAESRADVASEYVQRRLYYGNVFRVIGAKQDDKGQWWYRLQEGITWSPGPYVLAQTLRRFTPEDLAPLSPGLTNKRIEIVLKDQTLTCYEGDQAVFQTRTSTGSTAPTPRGEFRVLLKRHTSRMIGEDYDLPGVAFPTYFTWSGIAVHGTYWHNDFGRPHSHGCINVPDVAARWVYRWTDPVAPYDSETLRAEAGTGTLITVV